MINRKRRVGRPCRSSEGPPTDRRNAHVGWAYSPTTCRSIATLDGGRVRPPYPPGSAAIHHLGDSFSVSRYSRILIANFVCYVPLPLAPAGMITLLSTDISASLSAIQGASIVTHAVENEVLLLLVQIGLILGLEPGHGDALRPDAAASGRWRDGRRHHAGPQCSAALRLHFSSTPTG